MKLSDKSVKAIQEFFAKGNVVKKLPAQKKPDWIGRTFTKRSGYRGMKSVTLTNMGIATTHAG